MPSSPYTDLDRPPLDQRALRRALVVPGGLWTDLEVRPVTRSTNADVLAAARAGAAEGLVVAAEQQSAGRGRLGREWISPPRAGLAVSVLLRPAQARPSRGWPAVPISRYGWLSLLAGVALAEAVTRLTELPAKLKWPNDLLIDGAKCAGILAEAAPVGPAALAAPSTPPELVGAATADAPAVVLGIGLNVTLRSDELPQPGAGLPVTSLQLAGASTADRDPLLRAVLRGLESWYGRWRGAGGDPVAAGLHPAYLRNCVTVGHEVRVSLPSGTVHVGVARTIDDDGRLVVRTADGDVAVSAGDVSHVRPGETPGNGTHG
ncbi:biotin--[acetyl-CoA-carboxylase] ligase [Micromonospora sp. NBC_01813]|uniref:biotin--[acetyl-CoA-carboxylase] ligase n=1 Tax=Micromonospora sp. NBC_01813 TaxID=2975988 RepID=UPI002DDB3996|nr:biotin--[acetyl-CoA-carboxylase] ligase [Micromonospora sp. NBC_01813]WSA12419.1 biotin--[acetyl-CoA-carboxylase] ligase [Micromonospora sp. NBC_01813]